MKAEKINLLNTRNPIMRSTMAVMVFMVIGMLNLQAQVCPLSCNDYIQVSLDEDCLALITPDMILEGDPADSNPICDYADYTVEITDEVGDSIVPNATLSGIYIGGTFKVRIYYNGSLNSCWTTLFLEDKLPPVVNCRPDTTISCNRPYTVNYNDFLDFADDNCNNDDMTVDVISDSVTDFDCTPGNDIPYSLDFDWFVQNEGDGTVNTTGAPSDIVLTGANNGVTAANGNDFCFIATEAGTVMFDWSYLSTDLNTTSDPFGYSINGAFVQVTMNGGPLAQAGSESVAITAGDVFCVSQETSIATNGSATTTVSDFRFMVDREMSAKRSITYVVVDSYGNRSFECTYCVNYVRMPIDSIVPPQPLISFECGISPASIWSETYPNSDLTVPNPVHTGYPTIDGLSIYPNVGFCELQASYTDELIPLCANTYKVLRHWVVLDWCRPTTESNNPSYYYQVIKVVDTSLPQCIAPNEFDVDANPYTCDAEITVGLPRFIGDDCSEIAVKLYFKERTPDGDRFTDNVEVPFDEDSETFTFSTSETDSVWLNYVVTDQCGNSVRCNTEIGIKDRTDPIAVCDEFTVVTLSNIASTWVQAKTFDDGSWDNCSPQDSLFFDVKRLGSENCDGTEKEYAEHIEFCCKDVGEDVMVIMRVTDLAGNSSTCMVVVEVDDKESPVWTYCPPDVTIACDELYAPEILFTDSLGFATASDNCSGVVVTYGDSNPNSCGFGRVTRTWRATDGTVTLTKRQFITIERDPAELTVIWPEDITIDGCIVDDTAATGYPDFDDNGQCYQAAVTFTDKRFEFVEGVCLKVLRRWVLIDWCIYTGVTRADGTIAGFYESEQVIKYTNSDAPVFGSPCTIIDEVINYTEACSAEVFLTANVSDMCTEFDDLTIEFQIDFGNDGSIDTIGFGGELYFPDMSLGNHRVRWNVQDECGNSEICEQVINVRDRKKPTPYCLGGVTTVVMPSTGTIGIWATDFDLGSYDNCPGDLTFSMRLASTPNAPLRTSVTFSCEQAGQHDVEIWVKDASGNSDYCITKVNIQANQECGDANGIIIGGNVSTEDDEMVEGVEVVMRNTLNSLESNNTTQTDGQFTFNNTSSANNYELTAVGDGNYINGVSTYDIVLIQRHILGVEDLDSPYKIIAADANNSESVTTSDIVSLRQLILGKILELPDNDSWRFVDENHNFPTPTNPWPFVETIYLNQIQANKMNNNFVAIKVGDVSGDARVNSAANVDNRSVQMIQMAADKLDFEAGEAVRIPVYLTDLQMTYGFQFTLDLDTDYLTFESIEGGSIDINSGNVNSTLSEEGLVAVSWENPNGLSIEHESPLFYINAKAKESGTSQYAIEINSELINAEIYDANMDRYGLDMRIKGLENTHSAGISLYQNVPNPFNNSTKIGFYLPKGNEAELKIYDITGKQIFRQSNHYSAGYNEINLESGNIETNGILYYQLNVEGYSETKKMIMIE